MEYDLGKIGLVGYKINNDTDIDDMIKRIIDNNTTTIDFEKIDGQPMIFHINNKFEYDINLQLGSGAYGTVFCIEANKIKYALKEQNYRKDNTALSEMLKEAIVHFILCEQKDASSHFPKIIQIAWNPTNFFIVMEYLDLFNGGETLNYIFENKDYRDTPQYMKDACGVATKIASIIQPLQDSLKFSHGDLNFGNIYQAKDKSVKLLDFGFSSVELGGKRIITNPLNTQYKPGKDLTIYTYSVLYNLDKPDYEVSNPDEFKIYSYFKTILPVVTYHTRIFYEDLDINPNNKSANPANILKNLGGCSPTVTGGARPRSHVRSARFRTRRSANNSVSKLRTKTKTKKLNSRNSQYKSLGKMLKSPIDLIHEKKLEPDALTKILETSSVEHIKNNASIIANLYLKEKEKSVALDLFKKLLYYHKKDFTNYCKDYSSLKTLEGKMMFLYGTTLLNKTYIHWNAVDTGIKLE
jgi:hypothetical protein